MTHMSEERGPILKPRAREGKSEPPTSRASIGPHAPAAILSLQSMVGNAVVQRLFTGVVRSLQRSPLSDELRRVWDQSGKGAFFDRLRQLNPATPDTDLRAFVDNTLRGDDQWLAQQILTYGPEPLWPRAVLTLRQQRAANNHWLAEPGHIGGVIGQSVQGRPIPAYYFPGQTDERALVIAGVHGTERQGVEVAEMLMNDLQHSPLPPVMTVIVVPTLFPDSQAAGRFGRREAHDAAGTEVPSNRNFPSSDQSLEGSRDRRGVARDARHRPILPENVALLTLMERFNPSRIVTIHGTHRPFRAGVFVDPVAGREADDRRLALSAARRVVSGINSRERAAGLDVTRDLSRRSMGSGRESLVGDIQARMNRHELAGRRSAALSADERRDLATSTAVAGNQLFLGAGSENSGWSGEVNEGVSLGGYAPARGMTVFTVEPAVNRNTADYTAGNTAGDTLTDAERRIELQSYADAVRLVLLGGP